MKDLVARSAEGAAGGGVRTTAPSLLSSQVWGMAGYGGRTLSITAKQRQVLEHVLAAIQQNRPPTIKGLTLQLGLSAASGVHQHVEALRRRELLDREAEWPWALKLHDNCTRERLALLGIDYQPPATPAAASITTAPEAEPVERVPVFGGIAAGQPSLAEGDAEATIALPSGFLGQKVDFALEARGTSMAEACILDGDLLLVRRHDRTTDRLNDGDIVVALLPALEPEGRATVKFLDHDQEGNRLLRPANPTGEAIDGNAALIQGKVVGVLRWLEPAPWRVTGYRQAGR